MADIVHVLAKRRVPLGFMTAAATLVLAQPTWASWRAGLMVALLGEAFRIWAAGHLEKGREVTRSGPYRWNRHPLYVGSVVMAAGVVIASRSMSVGVLAALYMVSTLTAAIRAEEAVLTDRFGDMYHSYRKSRAEPMHRGFSVSRAMRNREYRAAAGLLAGFALLALKVRPPL